MTGDYEFLVLACDGIWDVLSNQEVIDFIRARIAQRIEPEIVSKHLKDCLSPVLLESVVTVLILHKFKLFVKF